MNIHPEYEPIQPFQIKLTCTEVSPSAPILGVQDYDGDYIDMYQETGNGGKQQRRA